MIGSASRSGLRACRSSARCSVIGCQLFARRDHPLFALPDADRPELTRFHGILTMVGHQSALQHGILDARGLAMPEQVTECISIDFTISPASDSDQRGMVPRHIGTAALSLFDAKPNRDIVLIASMPGLRLPPCRQACEHHAFSPRRV